MSVSSDAGVGHRGPIPAEQMEVYSADLQSCSLTAEEEHSLPEQFALTDEVLEQAWIREKQSWACLRDAGHELQEVPSLMAYSDRIREDQPYSTWALLIDEGLSDSEHERLAQVCPDPLMWFGQ